MAAVLWGAAVCGAADLAPVRSDASAATSAQPARAVRDAARLATLETLIERLRPLALPLAKPGPGDWLAVHPDEPGQTFREYVAGRPVMLTAERSILYVQPLGTFTKSQRKIVEAAAEFLGLYYNARVKITADLAFGKIPADSRRTSSLTGEEQILTGYILENVLAARLPKDAAAMIAFTATDLWPGAGWNFVFGQAQLHDRVGVWSIKRFGDPDADEAAYRLCLTRTIKLAAHETGHMFSMLHCRAYSCCMCGGNSLPECDGHPLEVCPECVAKVWWATGADPAGRYRKLEEFCRHEKCLKAIEPPPAAPESGKAAKGGA
jgi:archaemetzincin